MAAKFRGKSFLSVNSLTRSDMDLIIHLGQEMKRQVAEEGALDLCKGRILANLFYEPSTRTSSSFHAAFLRLGGTVLPLTDVKTSSVAKGETLEDTVRTLQSYVDIIVLRHPQIGSAVAAAKVLDIPLINAGDGAGEHPTQALLDIFTIAEENGGKIDGLTITMVGDLKYGRTVHSLSKLLALFKVNLIYVAPDFLQMPTELIEEITKKSANVTQFKTSELLPQLHKTDILYVTRVQKERFTDLKEYEKAESLYRITPELINSPEAKTKSSIRILHPLPRVNELDSRLDSDPRAAYFRQMRCGLYVRMALLALICGKLPAGFHTRSTL